MKLLLEMLNMVTESDFVNIANGGGNTISVSGKDGEEIETIHSFNKIMDRFLQNEVYANNNRLTPEVKDWYSRNFTNWLKRGAKGADLQELAFGSRYYEPVRDYIDDLVNYHSDTNITFNDIIAQFPDYIQKDVDNSVIFSGGRLFRLNKLIPTINNLSDYLLANQAAAADPARAINIIPPTLYIGTKFTGVQAPDALAKSAQWHAWVEQNKEKVTREQLLQSIAKLKQGTDYEIDMKFDDGSYAVKILSANGTDVEGLAMNHCVASYGLSLEKGEVELYSIRDATGIPRATIDWSEHDKKALQIKGPHNNTIPNEVLNQTWQWLVAHGVKSAKDLHLIKVNSIQDLYNKVNGTTDETN